MARLAAFASFLLLAFPFAAGAAPSGISAPAGALSPYTAVTAGDFVAGCKRDRSSCAAMVGQVLMNRIQFWPTSHICLPGVSYADGVETWLAAHPETEAMRAHDGIFLALSTLYRCGGPDNY